MKIDKPTSAIFDREKIKQDLQALLDQPPPAELPPCPNCERHIPNDCTSSCPSAHESLSSEPKKHPLEKKVVPLVFELASTGAFQTCWSCEGHADSEGRLWRIPQISFYAGSPVYAQLLLKYINNLDNEKKLSYSWRVCVSDYGPLNGLTYNLEPNLNFLTDPHIGKLQQDLIALSTKLFENLQTLARSMLDKV